MGIVTVCEGAYFFRSSGLYLLVCFETQTELRQEGMQLTEFNGLKHTKNRIVGHGEICRKTFYNLSKDLPFRTEVISYCNSIAAPAAPCCDDGKEGRDQRELYFAWLA